MRTFYYISTGPASVVLGSATPSVEAFSWCQGGSCTMLELKNRATRQVMPKVYTVDMREELKNGNRSILSDRLTELMEKCLSEHHQMMLFLNRRGYAGFVSCSSPPGTRKMLPQKVLLNQVRHLPVPSVHGVLQSPLHDILAPAHFYK